MAGNEEPQPNNLLLFRLAVSNSFKLIAESVSENEFLEILTTLKQNRSTAQKLHKAMIKELCEGMNYDLEDIVKDGSLQEALAKVSKLAEETEILEDENAWRPPGDVKLHLRSLEMEKMKDERQRLEKWVNEMEHENEVLTKELASRRATIHSANDRITSNLIRISLQRFENKLEQLKSGLQALEKT